MANKYDWGIYTGVGNKYDFKDKDTNIRNNIHYMLNRSFMLFEYEGLPDTLPKVELERMLQVNGYCFITEVDGEIYGFNGGLGGERDVYGRPTEIIISNPALKLNKTMKLEEGVLIKNDDMMMGLIPIYGKYTSMLAENEITMILANVNKRVNNLISVADDNTGESARRYLKKLYEGELGYIFENRLYDSFKTNHMNGQVSSKLQDLIEFNQYIKATMYNEIGLNANFNMKRSRLVADEVDLNLDGLYPLIDNMLNQREDGLLAIKEKYGLDIEVSFASSWEYREIELEEEAHSESEELDDEQVEEIEEVELEEEEVEEIEEEEEEEEEEE